ncbi:MAG: methyltransferase domain-containing protein [Brevundimonas diminuta]|jgi:2-polyprenyl-3-methyl-5-hydroxy-6-metoxy-1,4-benzoquinol methylase|uniref:Uncharacterized protein n=2 Tax=Brevundimonas diminuta TaxID=293 RepID=A0A1Z3LYT8_BREDI|nr:hypothetical protein CD943_10920 [Brevundimonas diminuta]MBI2250057.1 methyltransferase domain-containing protein [Brevundimonas diminuta]
MRSGGHVSALIAAGGHGLDAFCGNGYGAELLSRTRTVLGLDGSSEAVAFTNQHFKSPRTLYAHAYWPFEWPHETYDFVVSLESLEHVPDGDLFFAALVRSIKPGGHLIFSTPNEDLLPHASTGNHFHFRHYTLAESLDLARNAKLDIVAWASQDCYQIDDGRQGALLHESQFRLKPKIAGQFTIIASASQSRDSFACAGLFPSHKPS